MYYIRFLKTPKFTGSKSGHKNSHELVAKITITNDLGELFLATALPLEIVLLVHLDQTRAQRHVSQLEWQSHARALDIILTIPSKYLQDAKGKALLCELTVQPLSRGLINDKSRATMGNQRSSHEEGRIVSVYSERFGLDHMGTTAATVRRVLTINPQTTMVIREEKGESIARHIWDAGLVLCELFHDKSRMADKLPRCSSALARKNLKAVELGTGVGLVGISLAHIIAQEDSGSAKVLLTDLDDAREIVEMNIAEALEHSSETPLEFAELDWTEPLPESVANEDWDIILIADCTYNPTYALALVNTIKALLSKHQQHSEKDQSLALLAMKPRHKAEDVFFEYMEQAGMRIIEEAKYIFGAERLPEVERVSMPWQTLRYHHLGQRRVGPAAITT